MDTRIAVQNAVWPYTFGLICHSIITNKDDSEPNENGVMSEDYKPAYDACMNYQITWRDGLKHHQLNQYKKNLKRISDFIIESLHDKQAVGGKGGCSVTKMVGVCKAVMENTEVVMNEGFNEFVDALEEIDQLTFKAFPEDYSGQFESGSIEKNAIKIINKMKEWGYYQ